MDESSANIKPIDLTLDSEEAETIIDDSHARDCTNKYRLMFENKLFFDVELGIRNTSET